MLLKLIGGALGLYLVALIALYAFQRNLVFAPATRRVLPSNAGLSDVDEVVLVTVADERLYCWYGKAQAGQPTFLFFHGNGGSVGLRDDKFRQLMAQGYGVFMLGYPGYGGSDGSPSEHAFMDAAELAYDDLSGRGLGASDIVIYGESIGSAVAVQLAAAWPARALILEAPMASALEIAQTLYPFMPVKLISRDPFLSIDHIADVRMPLLVVHGDEDSIIPIASARRLFEHANEPKTFHTLKGAGHNNLYAFPIVEVVKTFLDRLRQSELDLS
jgi:pimeloyl-ACP methyl ester carboxylesterase